MNRYITTDEALRLFTYSFPEQSNGSPAIFLDFLKHETDEGHPMDFGYAARALFNAGRIAGIREERTRRKRGKK